MKISHTRESLVSYVQEPSLRLLIINQQHVKAFHVTSLFHCSFSHYTLNDFHGDEFQIFFLMRE